MNQGLRFVCGAVAFAVVVCLCDGLLAQEKAPGPMRGRGEARSLFMSGMEEERKGDLEQALQTYARVVKGHPRDNWAGCSLVQIGLIGIRQGKAKEAAEAFQRALQEFPKAAYGNGKTVAPFAGYFLAMAYCKMGKDDEAMKEYEEAVREYPDATTTDGRSLAAMFLGTLRAEKRKRGGAMPASAEAQMLFSRAVKEAKSGDIQAAMKTCEELARKYPKDNWGGCGLNYLGTLKMKEGNFGEAIELFLRVVREYPLARYANGKRAASFAAYDIATCYHKIGEQDQAMKAFDEAVKEYPDACTGDGDGGTSLRERFLKMTGQKPG